MSPKSEIVFLCIILDLNVSSTAHDCGCMVDGGDAVAAI